MTEKMGGAEGTKLDVDFVDMERVCIEVSIVLVRIPSCMCFNLLIHDNLSSV